MSYALPMNVFSTVAQAQDNGSSGLAAASVGTAPTYGAYSEIIHSTNFTANSIRLACFVDTYNHANPTIFKFAVGASGSEVDLLVDLPMHTHAYSFDNVLHAVFPVQIPKGSRISFAVADDNSAGYARYGFASVQVLGGGLEDFRTSQTPTTYGVTTASAVGTTVTSGTGFVRGSYAQITASCAEMSSAYLVVSATDDNGGKLVFDIAVGGSGSEQIIVPDLMWGVFSQTFPRCAWLPISVPAGSRLSIRCQNNYSYSPESYEVAIVGMN
jgi:hypothetical protein